VRAVISWLCTALAMAASPAYANPQAVVTIFEQPRHDGAIGTITHINMDDHVLTRMINTETERGLFVLRLNNTQNNLCVPACPDTLEVWLLPDNIVAVPASVTTPEGGSSVMTLYEWNGM
jgi:hypothetical protein